VKIGDAQYADELVAIFSDDQQTSFMVSTPRPDWEYDKDYFSRYYDVSISQEEHETIYSQLQDPASFANGVFVGELKKLAVAKLPPTHKQLGQLEVRLVPNWALNAQIALNPGTGSPIVLLNAGVMHLLQVALNIYFALTVRNTQPDLRFISFEDLFKEFMDLVQIAIHGIRDENGPRKNVAKFGVLKNPRFVVHLTTLAETFLLLHEYAHIALGHIPIIDFSKFSDTPDGAQPVHIMDRSTHNEISADIWAIRCLTSSTSAESPFDEDVVLFAYGFLMLFFETCYRMDPDQEAKERFGYPEYVYRWEAIKTYFEIERHSDSFLWTLDSWFSRIIGYAVRNNIIPNEKSTEQ
jgi:hypothetical protein